MSDPLSMCNIWWFTVVYWACLSRLAAADNVIRYDEESNCSHNSYHQNDVSNTILVHGHK